MGKAIRFTIGLMGIVCGGWMTYDGSRAMLVGDYVTRSSGPRAGELGPWSLVVAKVGIPPRSTGMKVAFVVLGIAWLAAASGYLAGERPARRALAILAVATLWYLPVGTAMSVLVLLGLAVRPRS